VVREPAGPVQRDQLGGQALAGLGPAEQGDLAVDQVGDARDRALQPVEREAQVPAVEVPAVIPPVSGSTSGLSFAPFSSIRGPRAIRRLRSGRLSTDGAQRIE
jgi:hypothetical protein